MKSKDWLKRNLKDRYIIDSKKKGYLSRAAYKLIQIDNKFNLLNKSMNILELGSFPGGWTQIIFEKNPNAKVIAFDLINMNFYNKNLIFYNKDFMKFDFQELNIKFDLILSDLAPNTIGHKSTDHLRICNLVNDTIFISKNNSKLKSNLVFKIWKGSEEKKIINALNKIYHKVSYYKPDASRKDSSEIFVIAQDFKKN